MITKFDSIFAGHVDMDNVGYGGTAVMDRFFSAEHLAGGLDKTVAIAKLMDRTGFDTFWMAEHHFQPEGYECLPNILIMSLHMAHLTERLKFGSAFNIAPMWHPLRLAEDFAMVDYLTGGRLAFGVGRGYHTREVETFGAPLLDQAGNRDLFEEQIEVIFKAFNQESFSHHGKYYDIPPDVPYRGKPLKEIALVPRPLNRPVDCWQPIQSATPRGLAFMAKHGMKGIIGGGVAEGGAMTHVIEAYRDALVAAGRTDVELGTDMVIGYHFHIGKTVEEATKEAAKYFEENIKMFGPLRLVRGLSDQQMIDIADPKRAPQADLPNVEDAVAGGGYLCGPPEYIIEKIMEVEEKYPGMNKVNVSHPMGVPESMILDHLQQFSEDVMPAFKNRVSEPVSAD
jgi:alkanesulfonate monooxygenase SsuD/methylene tetrahydromethanopterin reductase-like flavin-dependent oxidoreductase (luciferase family)